MPTSPIVRRRTKVQIQHSVQRPPVRKRNESDSGSSTLAGSSSSEASDEDEDDDMVCTTDERSNSTSRPGENVAELLERLKDPPREDIALHYDKDKYIVIKRDFLGAASPWFERALSPGFREGNQHYLRFGNVSCDVMKVVIYWLFHKRVATISELDAEITETSYQHILCDTWLFAEDKEMPALQNVAIRRLVTSFEEADVKVDMLKKVLPRTRRGSILRKALVQEVLWLENERDEILLDRLMMEFTDGYSDDLAAAKREFVARRQRRGRAEWYLVKE